MAENCKSCGKEIEETFLGKLKGTTIKNSQNTEKGFCYICSECQKNKGRAAASDEKH